MAVAERMLKRDISQNDVVTCIKSGEIIEDYLDDYPHPSCLIFGYTADERVLYVVAGIDGEYLFVITTYIPDIEKFEEDMKTRRKKL